jgi:hypothetical protein
MNDRTFDLNTWMETYKEAFSSFGKAQQESFKALERFARFHYSVAGDVLEAGIAQAKATLAPKVAVGTNVVADLLQKQADLGSELSDKLKARAEEFSAMAADVQQTVGGFAAQAANRATRATRATRTTRTKRKAA